MSWDGVERRRSRQYLCREWRPDRRDCGWRWYLPTPHFVTLLIGAGIVGVIVAWVISWATT